MEGSKTSHARKVESLLGSSESPEDAPDSADPQQSWGLVEADFPQMKYWRRQAWKVHEDEQNDSTGLVSKRGQRGGARSARGINVMMQYIENADGSPISGDYAAEMREFTRSIWRGLDKRKAAPEKWGDATKDVRKHFYFEMEKEFYMLRLCENHWKSQAIATAIYSQWCRVYVKKCRAVKDEDDLDEEPATKRPRVAKSEPTPGPTSSHNDSASMSKAIIPIDPL